MHHIKIPNIFFDKAVEENFGTPSIRRRYHAPVRGVNYFRDADTWLSRRAVRPEQESKGGTAQKGKARPAQERK